MDGFKHRAIILMQNSQIDVVWSHFTGRDLRLDSLRNKDLKTLKYQKLKSSQGPNRTGCNDIRLADFCIPTDHSQMYNISSHLDEKGHF